MSVEVRLRASCGTCGRQEKFWATVGTTYADGCGTVLMLADERGMGLPGTLPLGWVQWSDGAGESRILCNRCQRRAVDTRTRSG